ncbi:MAG TPA: dTMP kinase [bacterium]|nr:dTMP kinase [bacterium]
MIPAHQTYPGFFFSFEGIDGSGKTEQSARLIQFLKREGRPALLVRDPGGTGVSEEIRRILLNPQHASMSPVTELLLYEAARAQLVSEVILPALKEGKIVISDRFTDSTTAYQGHGRALPPDRVEEANRTGALDLLPDRTYFLDIDWEESCLRRERESKVSDRMENNAHAFFERVRNGYREIAKKNPGRVLLLEGKKPREILEQEIRQDVIDILRIEEKG